ncbi:MAG: hypothetical protein C0615_11175, partial [Desulfuromonas sp.]
MISRKILSFFVLILLTAGVVNASQINNKTVKYYIDVDSHRKGLLEFSIKDDSVVSSYYGVSNDDRIPFFVPSKSFTTSDGLSLNTLSKGKDKYTIYYDIDKAPKRARSYIAGDASTKAIVWDEIQQNSPWQFEKIPAVVMESMLLGFINNKIKPNENLMFYDGTGRTGIRLYFEEAPSSDLSLAGMRCAKSAFTCKRTNIPGKDDVSLFKVFLNRYGVPVKVLANSGRWSLELGAVASGPKQVEFDVFKDLANSAKRDFSQKVRSMGSGMKLDEFSLKSKNQREIVFNYAASTSHVTVDNDKSIVLKLLAKMLRTSSYNKSAAKMLKPSGGGYAMSVDADDVCDQYRDDTLRGEVSKDCKTVAHEMKKSVYGRDLSNLYKTMTSLYKCDKGSIYIEESMGSDDFICKIGGEEIEVDLELLAQEYLSQQTGSEIKIKDVDLSVRQKSPFLQIEYLQDRAVDQRAITRSAARIFADELGTKNYMSIENQIVRKGDEYLL